jgi:hypothetical protein
MKTKIHLSTAQKKVVDYLKDTAEWDEAFRSSPHLSSYLGIRNIPDVIMKLRRKGLNIKTRRADVTVRGAQYENVGIYKLYKTRKRK